MGDRLDYLNKACDLLEQNENVLSLKKSNLYETKAWGYTDQADFLNMCVEIETSLDPYDLLSICQDIENKLNRLIEKENGNIINICVSLYDHLIQVGKLRKNNKFFRKIFENIKTSDNLMFIKKENRNIKLEQKLYDLYDKNKEILNVRNKEEFRLVVEMLFAITRRRIVASLKYKDLYEARNDYLKEIEFIKNGILK